MSDCSLLLQLSEIIINQSKLEEKSKQVESAGKFA